MHKSLRSTNVLFFKEQSLASLQEKRFALEEPYLSGWEYSRPESEFSSRINDNFDIREDIYRHPNQWGVPTERFNRTHDIYALGVILLEIGLWKTAESLHSTKFQNSLASSVKSHLLLHAGHQRLKASMGRRYQSIVLKCLQGSFETEKDGAYGEEPISSFKSSLRSSDDDIVQAFKIEVSLLPTPAAYTNNSRLFKA